METKFALPHKRLVMSSGHVRNGPGDQTPLGPGSVNNITVDVAEHSATSQRHTPAPFSHQQPSHMGDITAQSEAGDSYAVAPNQQQVFMTNVLIQLESIQSKLNILQHTTREVIARQELIERKIDTVESRIENIQNAVPQVSQSPGMPLTAEAFQQFPGLASRYVPSNPDHQALMSAIVAAIQDPSRATAQQIQQSAQHIRGMSPGNNATPKRRKMSGPRDSVNEIQEIGGETLLSVGTVQPPEVIMSTMKQPLVNGTSPIRAPGPNNLLVRQPSISMAGAPAKVSAFNNSLRVGNTASIPSPMGIGPSPRHSSPFGPITSLASLPIPIGSPTVNKTAPVTPMATSSPTPQHILNHTIPTLSLPRAHSNTSALSMRPMALPPPPVSPAASLASLQQSTAGSFTFTNNHNGYAKRNRDSILERTIRANGINTGLSNGNALHLIAKTEPSLAAQLAGHGPNSNSSSTTSSIGMNLPLKHQETVLTPNQIASTLSSPLARNLRAFVPNNLINSTNLYLDPTGVSSRHLAPLRNTDMHVTNVQAASMPLNFDIVQHANHGNMLMTQSSMNSVVGHTNGEIDNTNEQFSNVKRHMTQIQRLVTEHASKHGESCKFVKDFALYKSIWELNRLSKKNPHVSLMKKMLQELPEQDWPTSEVKGYVEGSIKKSEMPNTQIYLLNELLAKFYDCYKQALLGSEHFRDDPDLHLSNEEFTKIMVTSFAIRNRQPQTQAKLQRKMESEILKSELLKKFKTDTDFQENAAPSTSTQPPPPPPMMPMNFSNNSAHNASFNGLATQTSGISSGSHQNNAGAYQNGTLNGKCSSSSSGNGQGSSSKGSSLSSTSSSPSNSHHMNGNAQINISQHNPVTTTASMSQLVNAARMMRENEQNAMNIKREAPDHSYIGHVAKLVNAAKMNGFVDVHNDDGRSNGFERNDGLGTLATVSQIVARQRLANEMEKSAKMSSKL